MKKNLEYVAEYGRYDDLLALMDTPCEVEMLSILRKYFAQDLKALREDGTVSLLAKWLPSVNASNAQTRSLGKRIAKALGLSEAEYRDPVALRAQIRIIENNLREKDYSFDYESSRPRRCSNTERRFHAMARSGIMRSYRVSVRERPLCMPIMSLRMSWLLHT